MKKALIILGSIVLVTTLAFPVLGYGPGRGGGCMDGYGEGRGGGHCWEAYAEDLKLSDEQRDQLETLHENFFRETRDLRDSIYDKRRELRTLMRGDDPDQAAALALQKEIHGLRGEMMEKRLNLQLESRKIAPELKSLHGRKHGHGEGRGHGRKGAGKYGYDCPRQQ
ncbi:MAG: periplasmic heavy metal sensor [Desulfobacterales bacterium]